MDMADHQSSARRPRALYRTQSLVETTETDSTDSTTQTAMMTGYWDSELTASVAFLTHPILAGWCVVQRAGAGGGTKGFGIRERKDSKTCEDGHPHVGKKASRDTSRTPLSVSKSPVAPPPPFAAETDSRIEGPRGAIKLCIVQPELSETHRRPDFNLEWFAVLHRGS